MSEQLTERHPAPARTPQSTWIRPRLTISGALRLTRWDVLAAMFTWAVALLLGELLVQYADLDPLTVDGVLMPVAAGAAVAAVLLVVLLRRPSSDVLVGITTGAYAGWIALVMAQSLHGTPFGYSGMGGDEGRLVAQAMKYMTSWSATDAFVRHLPPEYPPLFPWLVGHVASVIHRPAWRVIGDAQIVLYSVALILAYALWRRVVSPRIAFLIVVLGPVIPSGEHFGDPGKAYEFAVLLVIVPWILETFTGLSRERGGLHWLPAGVIGGLIVLTYPAYLAFALLGVVATILLSWRGTSLWRRHLPHLVGVTLTAFVVASWYVVPFVVQSVSHGGNRLSDLWRAPSMVKAPVPLPFLEPAPIGLIALAGLVGLVWYRGREWWAQPMLLLLVSSYVYRLLFLLVTAYSSHTGYLEYTDRLSSVVLVSAGVMTLACALPEVTARAFPPTRRLREIAALLMVAVVAWAGVHTWSALTPEPGSLVDANSPVGAIDAATAAHLSALPNGEFPRFAPAKLVRGRLSFPVNQIKHTVEATLGRGARPESISYSDLLFAFLPYYGYLPHSRLAANTLQRWDDRFASLQRLSRITDPTGFADRSAHLPFGRVDVFVLREWQSKWVWPGYASPVGDQRFVATLKFRPKQFSSRYFDVFHLPSRTVVAIRLPAS